MQMGGWENGNCWEESSPSVKHLVYYYADILIWGHLEVALAVMKWGEKKKISLCWEFSSSVAFGPCYEKYKMLGIFLFAIKTACT